ncbi:hypothetical protein NQ176_g3319 [Zarea fungicola]|uniref:Uncharacterized protein n=1 Tax=Zarea fungicola TaxID=93591 RepID=A0ACC1NJ43_9HYPO|nr:hypothetical protein NQ176_g3319 [Lecanicillium fungicola]
MAGKFLLSLSCVFSLAAAEERFYYDSGCSGNYYSFDITKYSTCFSLPNGYASSFWTSSNLGRVQQYVAYSQSSGSDCGYAACSFNPVGGNHCCSSSKKNIKGAATYAVGTKRDDAADVEVQPSELGPKQCVDISRSMTAHILLADGSYYSLGQGVANITVDSLQRQLEAAGKATLGDLEISKLRADGFVV